MDAPATRRLNRSGLTAELRPDQLGGPGFTLLIGGEEQSHVFAEDPRSLRFDYLRRIANVADLLAPAGSPLGVLHLGGGALTLARYIEATRPGSPQLVVEHEAELLDFVTAALPLPAAADIGVLIDDARAGLAAASRSAPFDLVVADVYLGSSTPSHLTSVEFYREVCALLAPGGVLAVNVADDSGLPLVRAAAATLTEVFETVLVTGALGLIATLDEGNAVLFASRSAGLAGWQGALRAAGPHPSGVIGSGASGPHAIGWAEFIGDARAVRDARA